MPRCLMILSYNLDSYSIYMIDLKLLTSLSRLKISNFLWSYGTWITALSMIQKKKKKN